MDPGDRSDIAYLVQILSVAPIVITSLLLNFLQLALSKDPEPQKDGSVRTEKATIFPSKPRSTAGDSVHHPRRPTSSVEADIVGPSNFHSSMLKQEASTASSKGYTFREGNADTMLIYVGQNTVLITICITIMYLPLEYVYCKRSTVHL